MEDLWKMMYNKVMQKSCTGSNNEICYLQTKTGMQDFLLLFFFWSGWGSILGPLPRSTPQTEEPFTTPPPPESLYTNVNHSVFHVQVCSKTFKISLSHVLFF